MADLIAIGYPDEATAELAANEARRLASMHVTHVLPPVTHRHGDNATMLHVSVAIARQHHPKGVSFRR